MSRVEDMKAIYEQIKAETANTTVVAPEPVRNSKEIDISSILASGLGSNAAILDNGEIIRNI